MDVAIIKLREETGAGVMQCKRALEATNGDYEKAKEFIVKEGVIKAETKKTRKTSAGILESYIHNGRVGVLLEVRCETDFVAKSDPFRELAREIVLHIAAMAPASIDELLDQHFIKNDSVTIRDLITVAVGKTGENIEIKNFSRYEL